MKSSSLAALLVVIVLSLWMLSGLTQEPEDVADDPASTAAEEAPMKVEVTPVRLTRTEREIVMQGQLDPWRQLEVRTEVSGIVARIAVEKGDRVGKDQLLVELDPGSLDAELREAQARVRSAASEEAAADSLQSQGLQSRVQLDQLRAQLQSARAQLDRVQRALDDTRIRAPFAAVINELPIETGQLLQVSDPVVALVDDSRLKVSAQAAQQQVDDLQVGQPVRIELLNGDRLEGELTFISPLASSSSRSFRIEARVDNSDGRSAAGVSATLRVPVETVAATFVSAATFSLDDQGTLGVKLVDADNRVVFQPIRLLRSDLDGAWVMGIPEGARLITLGQGFVTAGETVAPTAVASEDADSPDVSKAAMR